MPRLAAAAVLLLAAAAARGQPAPEPASLRGDSPQTRKRLAEAEAKLLAGKAGDAADDLQRVLDEAGDDLVGLDGKQFRPARLVAHGLLARLPADALKAYQARIDAPAKQLLDAGKKALDPRPLWQLMDRYFVSRPAQEGGLILGDLLFERGEFRAAELVWRRLLPDGGADVSHPLPPADPAGVRARVVLAVSFQLELDRAAQELEAFTAKYPAAAGPFAGRTGPYATTLKAFLDRPPVLPPEAPAREWPAFGGGPDRAGRVAGPIPYHWPGRPTWREQLPVDRERFPTAPTRPPFGHPVIAGGKVVVSDGSRVVVLDLRTGSRGNATLAPEKVLPFGGPRSAEAEGGITLSTFADRVFARIGPTAVRPPDARPGLGKAEDAALVCFAPPEKVGRFSPPLRELWRVRPPAAPEGRGPAVWEGSPLAADGRLWAAFARFDGGRVAHGVACFDPAAAVEAPDRPAWVTEVGDSPLAGGAESRGRHELVARAGRNVVLATNVGTVVALDAVTGKRAWGFVYPRATKRSAEANRAPDPAPAVAAGGRVFVAPADADRVYALDAETGRLLWESTPVGGAQILGVTGGRVVVTVTGPVRGIRGLDVVTGSHRAPEGWAQHDGGGLLGYGRGLVADRAVFWPSRGGLFILDPATGYPVADPLQAPGTREGLFGNLAYADGVLVVVTPTEVWGYVADAPPPPRPAPDPSRRYDLVADAAEVRLAAGDEPAARQLLLDAARGDYPPAFRAWAAARLVLLTPPGTDEANYPADLRAAVEGAVRSEWVLTAGGDFLTLAGLIDRHAGRAAPARPPPTTLPARQLEETPTLGPDARVTRTLPLPPGLFPLLPLPGATTPSVHLFAADPARLFAVPLAGGAPRPCPAADRFTHAADLRAGFVAAGPFAVAVYGAGVDPEWVFRVPDTDPLPDSPGRVSFRTGEPDPLPQLSAFTLAGDWLLARLGDGHLVGLDLAGRRVGWVLGGHGRPRYEPVTFPGVPGFGPHLYAVGALAAAQLSDGRRWFVHVPTGRVCDCGGRSLAGPAPPGYGERTAGAAWAQPPAPLDGNRIAFSDGPGLVRAVAPGLDKTVWEYVAGRTAGLSGEPPRVRAWGPAVVVAVRRNHGCELDLLDPADGTSRWEEPAFLDAARTDLSAADADAERVYVPAGGRLAALSLEDGSEAWGVPLPRLNGSAGWRVRAGRRAVIAYPAEAVPGEPVAEVWGRVVRSFGRAPLAWRVPFLAGTLADTWTERTAPVLLFDPETGELLKQLTLPAHGPGVTVCLHGDVTAVMTGAGVTWLR